MRLSEWRTRAPHKDAMTPKVLGVVESVLAALGADDDARCWVIWGDDPGVRYVLLAPTDVGLVQVLVRVNVPGESPRASAKVIRWNRVQLGELALEMVSGHRLLGFQVESHVLRGSDDEGDAMAQFALELFARVDGRPFTPPEDKRGRPAKGGAARAGAAKPAAKSGAAKPAAARTGAATPAAARGSGAKPAGSAAPGKPAAAGGKPRAGRTGA